jgi:hypothetical protein
MRATMAPTPFPLRCVCVAGLFAAIGQHDKRHARANEKRGLRIAEGKL